MYFNYKYTLVLVNKGHFYFLFRGGTTCIHSCWRRLWWPFMAAEGRRHKKHRQISLNHKYINLAKSLPSLLPCFIPIFQPHPKCYPILKNYIISEIRQCPLNNQEITTKTKKATISAFFSQCFFFSKIIFVIGNR